MDPLILLIGGGIVLLVATLFLLLGYSGLFASVDVKTGPPPIGKVYIAYKDGCGPYRNAGSYFSESTSIAPALKQIGLYYDDPVKVPENKLRWAVGAILAEDDEEVDPDIRLAYEKEKYKFMTLPKVSASVNSTFPYATMVSIFIAVHRVYPRFAAYVEEFRLDVRPCLEVYFGGFIYFMAPLSNQKEFYSPKALESEQPQITVEAVPVSETDQVRFEEKLELEKALEGETGLESGSKEDTTVDGEREHEESSEGEEVQEISEGVEEIAGGVEEIFKGVTGIEEISKGVTGVEGISKGVTGVEGIFGDVTELEGTSKWETKPEETSVIQKTDLPTQASAPTNIQDHLSDKDLELPVTQSAEPETDSDSNSSFEKLEVED